MSETHALAVQIAELADQIKSLQSSMTSLNQNVRLNQNYLHPMFRTSSSLENPYRFLHLVYGAPKTGNTTLVATIAKLGIADNIWSAHYLSDTYLQIVWNYNVWGSDGSMEAMSSYKNLLSAQNILKQSGFYKGFVRPTSGVLSKYKLPVITSLREPISHAISSIAYYYPRKEEQEVLTMARAFFDVDSEGEFKVDKRMNCKLPHLLDDWIRRDFTQSLDFDPYAESYDFSKGYSIKETETLRMLFCRIEDFEHIPHALGEFYSIPSEKITIETKNTADERSNAGAYRNVVKNFKLPEHILRKVYASTYCKTFYSEAEIEGFIQKWVLGGI